MVLHLRRRFPSLFSRHRSELDNVWACICEGDGHARLLTWTAQMGFLKLPIRANDATLPMTPMTQKSFAIGRISL